MGDSISSISNTYFFSGTYYDTLISTLLCDSIVITNLTVNGSLTYVNEQSICTGESYSIGSSNYSTPGMYFNILQDQNGCDSNVSTILTVVPNSFDYQNITICEGETWAVGFNNYSQNGIYYDTLSTNNGCDSIITTNLTVENPNAIVYISANTLIANVSGGQPPYSYELFGPNNFYFQINSNGGGEIFFPIDNGIYYFYATDDLGCTSDTIYQQIDFNLSLEEEDRFNSKLLMITDLLGRETQFKLNTLQMYIYTNGVVKRKYFLKEKN